MDTKVHTRYHEIETRSFHAPASSPWHSRQHARAPALRPHVLHEQLQRGLFHRTYRPPLSSPRYAMQLTALQRHRQRRQPRLRREASSCGCRWLNGSARRDGRPSASPGPARIMITHGVGQPSRPAIGHHLSNFFHPPRGEQSACLARQLSPQIASPLQLAQHLRPLL